MGVRSGTSEGAVDGDARETGSLLTRGEVGWDVPVPDAGPDGGMSEDSADAGAEDAGVGHGG